MAWGKNLSKKEIRERERIIEKRYRDNNKQKLSIKGKKYYLKNREKLLSKSKQYHKNNPEVNLKSGQKYLNTLGVELNILTKDVKRVLMNWKRTIQKRDKICQVCGSINNLHAHHILHRKYYPKLALNINNGIILCDVHHKESHGWCLN